jgi:uncharacterized protein YihD (DUF1040 family)
MRDTKRIDVVLEEIKKIWMENPDLRLGQLLLNVCDSYLYYVEDDVLVKALKEVYKPSNIIYGKVKQEDGSYVEDKNMIARKFGNITKACFTCKKEDTCTATKLEDCKPEKKENVVCFPHL